MSQKGVQIMGQSRLCLSLRLVSLWRKSGWRDGAFKKIWRLFIITAFVALFADVELPNQARSRTKAGSKYLYLLAHFEK